VDSMKEDSVRKEEARRKQVFQLELLDGSICSSFG
jgi:hypothetical protein